jgi:hypothetical protein
MAKRGAAPEGVRVILTPRALLWYHMGGEYSCWHPGIGWFELHQYPPEKGQKPTPPQLKYFHFMHSDVLAGAVYYRFPGSEKQHVSNMPATVKTTAEDFENYLRRKVWQQKTATSEVFRLLGLKKPPQAVTPASADVLESLNELYKRTATIMGLPEDEVRKKYAHLNPGLQAMNLRNRLRARGQAV